MVRQFVLSLYVMCFDVGLAERATKITMVRVPLLQDPTGGSSINKTIITGEMDHKAVSHDVHVQADASFDIEIAKASADVSAMAQAAKSSYSVSYEEIQFHHQCQQGTGCYIYQTQTTIVTDLTVYQSQSSYQVSTGPLSLDSVDVPVQEGTDMGDTTVEMVQPEEQKGKYDCRSIVANVCDEMSHSNGCRTVDDFHCSSGQMPFKWGGQSYFGGWHLPEGLCVTPYKEWKASDWGHCVQGTEWDQQKCATGGSRYIQDWQKSNRICSWRFELAPNYYCKGGRVVKGSLEVEFPEKLRDGHEEAVV
jgi:hypothetical protein